MANSLRILISNDDGISSPGLAVLEKIAYGMTDDVWVVAPETEQSGASHSLTINNPLRMRQVGQRQYAVLGTPTDCIILAVCHLMQNDKRPDILLSGINIGANLGEDVTYSGTVAAAVEGALLGIRSIALSQVVRFAPNGGWKARWEVAEFHAGDVIRKLLSLESWPEGVLMNVNFPDRELSKVGGLEATVQGQRNTTELAINKRMDNHGVPYYWIGHRMNPVAPETDTDFSTIARGGISVTPLRVDMSDVHVRDQLQAQLK